jgi:pimeloyl-ACP methyl ester carboxylesterase/DNA-binding CsgD family transcriptional regulator
MSDGPDATLLVETLYRIAARPSAWDELTHVLDPNGTDPQNLAELSAAAEYARKSRLPGEGPPGAAARGDLAFLVLAASGAVIDGNGAAFDLLAAGLGAAEPGQPLILVSPANGVALAEGVRRARSEGRQVVFRLDRAGGEAPVFAYALPAALAGARLGAEAQAWPESATVLVFPALEPTAQLWAGIRESFGLTEAELRLARRLRDGAPIQQAADDLGISVNTARNQLRGVFDKMGLQRQSDLVRVLTELSVVANAMRQDEVDPWTARVVESAPPIQLFRLADGRALAWRDYGDPVGLPILFFHEGLGSCLLPPETDAAARALGLRAIAADRPGFGRSDRPLRPYDFDGVAEDMIALCDHLGLERLRITAALSGAPTALETAARLGARVEMVTLISGRAPRAQVLARPGVAAQFRARIEANPWIVEALYGIIRYRRSRAMIRDIARRTATAPEDRAFIEAHPAVIDYVSAVIGESLLKSSRATADELRAFRRAHNRPAPAITAPVVVWHGTDDTFASLDTLKAWLGPRIRETHLIPGAGHMMGLKHWREIMARSAAPPPVSDPA